MLLLKLEIKIIKKKTNFPKRFKNSINSISFVNFCNANFTYNRNFKIRSRTLILPKKDVQMADDGSLNLYLYLMRH